MTHAARSPAGVVWIASFPKSGNTWMRVLLANLVADSDAPQDINDLEGQDGIASGRETFEAHTLVDSFLLSAAEIDRLRPAAHEAAARAPAGLRFIKVHDAYSRLSDGTPLLGHAARAAIYLVRDPRDVAVSFAFHQNVAIDEAIAAMNRPQGFLGATNLQFRQHLGGWSGHVHSWITQPDMPQHIVRYEDMIADTAVVLRRVADFIDLPATDDQIRKACAFAAFDGLQRQERDRGFRERPNAMAQFFRAGRAGAWRERLDARQVRTIETAHAPMMREFGYALEAA